MMIVITYGEKMLGSKMEFTENVCLFWQCDDSNILGNTCNKIKCISHTQKSD